MRIIYLSKAILTVLFSCAKNSEQINVAKNEVEKNVSEVEKKGINYTCNEMSDREAYSEIIKYHQYKSDQAHSTYELLGQKFNLGKYRTNTLDEMENSELKSYLILMNIMQSYLDDESNFQELASNDIKGLSKLKDKNTYYKILAVKTSSDTILYKTIYLDNKNKIIVTNKLR
jgi:hypothetical protein